MFNEALKGREADGGDDEEVRIARLEKSPQHLHISHAGRDRREKP